MIGVGGRVWTCDIHNEVPPANGGTCKTIEGHEGTPNLHKAIMHDDIVTDLEGYNDVPWSYSQIRRYESFIHSTNTFCLQCL